MDTHFHKPAEPWEKTEGYVNTLAIAILVGNRYILRLPVSPSNKPGNCCPRIVGISDPTIN